MLLIVLVISVVGTVSDAARILGYFPMPAFSHQITFRPLIQELLNRGHEVVVITPLPAFPKGQAPPNLTEIDIHDIVFNVVGNKMLAATTGYSHDLIGQIETSISLFHVCHEDILYNEEIKNIIRNKNDTFDLMILELCFYPGWVLMHVIKAPTVFISSFGGSYRLYDVLGAPSHIFLYPAPYHQKLHNVSFWDKINALYTHYQIETMLADSREIVDEVNRKLFGPDTPSLSVLVKNVDILFLNVHPLWEGNRPVPPNVVFTGAIHIKPVKQLPEDLKAYLDSSKNGVIYISFGTNVLTSMLPPERIQILVKVFSKLPFDVLWKYDNDELPGTSNNIRIEKWLPQSDLLRHPKVKMFITQGGLQSTDEAITAGVPLIGIPMFGDQWFNVEYYVLHKIGIRIDMETITEEIFMNAIQSILNDESYRQNIIRLREIMTDQPQRPLDRAVWWAEHVIRHRGAKHLKSAAANLTWAQYYEIELVTVLLAALLAIVLIVSFAIYCVWKFVTRKIAVKFKSL